jgi:DNA integrity scanning protein DisA with diadenylate cyclase activity
LAFYVLRLAFYVLRYSDEIVNRTNQVLQERKTQNVKRKTSSPFIVEIDEFMSALEVEILVERVFGSR